MIYATYTNNPLLKFKAECPNMPNLTLRTHPQIVFAYSPNHIEVIVRVENDGKEKYWAEADINVPERLSLSPDNSLRKGRVRIGIVDGSEYIEKSVRVYANTYTNPQMYRCTIALYLYNKDGIIQTRMDKPIDIRCEIKKPNTL